MTGAAIRAYAEANGYNSPEYRFQSAVECTRHVLRIEQATRSLRGREAARVLDFGCGWGEFLAMAHLFGFEAVGVERSPDKIEELRQAGVTAFPDIESLREGIDAGFHAVTLFWVLEHVEEPLELLTELRGVMAAGAILVLAVPDCSGVTGIHDLADFRKIDPLEHINCFTPTSLAKMARLAGFEPIPRPIAHVTTRATKVLKGEVRRLVQGLLPPTTVQYFRRTPRE
jgi:2-polyprenyl-3-methyl-5-hydroxy-6-metoxy-1,4-benzoquinol methylase